MPKHGALASIATGSCGNKKLADLRYGFAMVESVGKSSQSEGFNLGLGFFACRPVGHNPRQRGDLGNPPTVVLLLEFDS